MNQRILHIAPTPFFADRGCHIRIEGIVHCLDELGYSNLVCTYHHGRNVPSVETRRISPIRNYTQTAAGPSKYKLWADWKLLWLVFNEYRKNRPVALHAHLHEGLLIGILIKTLFFWRGTPLIADMQGSLTGELEAHGAFKKLPPLKKITWLFEKVLMWFPTHIICSSHHSLEKLKAEFKIDAAKISLAQDGADIAAAPDDQELAELREALGLPSNKTIAVYSGALLDSKGLPELKNLIAASDPEHLHFLIIGYPEQNLSEYLARIGRTASCTLTGQVPFEKLATYLKLADIAVDPKNSSAGEGSGKMLNYLAAGLPVAAFDSANNREFLPADAPLAKTNEELARIVDEWANDKDARLRQASRALDHFRQHHSWQVTRSQLQTVYRAILS